MASKAHQFMVMCISRKMREEGYEIIALEGDYTKISTIPFKIPPKIIRHRPDIISISENKSICIGEAKTNEDLLSKRTKEQFLDYANIINNSNGRCKLIIAIPKTGESLLKKILKNLNLEQNKQVSYLTIPEILFPRDEHDEI